ncbi:MAG: type I phosphomannose isomerase catalytic subunit [Planctomycetota bacterium]
MDRLLHPLRFARHEVTKPWGGRRLETCPGIELRASGNVGETWEIVDRPKENPPIKDGPFAGRTLGELMKSHQRDLLGAAPATPHGRFPLLIKYLDAQKNLSVQVHPDDPGAVRIGGTAEPKTEAWYFLDTQYDEQAEEPKKGLIYCGLKSAYDDGRFAEVMSDRRVVDSMQAWKVRAGQAMLVPGGTVHAIGAGVTLLEVQQNSDTTYRVWDWDRMGDDGKPRELHTELARKATLFDLPERPPVDPEWLHLADGLECAQMARTTAFAMNVLRVSGRSRLSTSNQFQIYAAVEGAGTLDVPAADVAVELRQGDVWLVPAAAGFHHVEPADGALTLVQLLTKA